MYKVLTLNQIAVEGLEELPRTAFELGTEIADPDAILVRSHKLSLDHVTPSLRAVARAGAGVNNIPVADYTERGVVVFNTPGANANSVKELVTTALLLSSRGILDGIGFVKQLARDLPDADFHRAVEDGKKQFKGREVAGKSLGVVGLGAIGSQVARVGLNLGMDVLGFDPAISVDAAWRLPSEVQRMENLQALFARADYVTLHVPALPATQHMINAESLNTFKPGSVLLNFAREEIVDSTAVRAALEANHLRAYFADFPSKELLDTESAVLLPHLGASTEEAEINCAVMAARQLKEFLQLGNIRNSVNFPEVYLEQSPGCRIALANRNVPRMLGQVMSVLADAELNVIDMLNKSRDDVAYNLIDVECAPSNQIVNAIQAIDGVINVRSLVVE